MTSDHTYASAIVGAQKTHKRKAADFYPSPPDVTQALMDHLRLPEGTRVWEPACGDGAMSEVMLANGLDVESTDLRQSGYGRGGVDFLATDPLDFDPQWIITNPPFNIAERFVSHAMTFTPNLALLLKSQFWHAARREKLFAEHPPSEILALTWRPAFLEAERGSSPLMDVIWCVWRRGANATMYQPLPRPAGFKRKRTRTPKPLQNPKPIFDILDDL